MLKIFDFLRDSNKWFIVIFAKPNIYLLNLLKQTIIMGVILTVFYFILTKIGLNAQTIPSNMHGLIGVVIGLLLVFRTNTAYDRWWEASKLFGELKSIFIYLSIKSNNNSEIKNVLLNINEIIFEFIKEEKVESSKILKSSFKLEMKKLYGLLKNLESKEFSNADRKMADFISIFCSLERIKETPIPHSYAFHIKISVFAYLMTLPIGLFFGLGYYSIPLVMVLFFIIAGIEIISNEIENPFYGDPNDLPIDVYKTKNKELI
jgi:putative membrane protein